MVSGRLRRLPNPVSSPRAIVSWHVLGTIFDARRARKPFGSSVSAQKVRAALGTRPGRFFELQLMRFQVWPPQNMPPKAQPWTLSTFGPFMAMVES